MMTVATHHKPDTAPDPARAIVCVLALLGCGVATYLTLYQWHVTSGVWDPLFGSGSSELVLTSPFTGWLPVPDATLGAVAYLVEAFLATLGPVDRWRTTPWLVLLFGAVLLGLGLTAVMLVLTQVVFVRAFCTLCLASAAISLINAWLGRDEVIRSLFALRGSPEKPF
jgi:uncharacterized membrane protein